MAGRRGAFPLLSLPDEAIEVVFSHLDLLSHVRLAAACAALRSLGPASPIAKLPLLLSPLADSALAQPLLRRFLSPLLRSENDHRDVLLIVVGSLQGWLAVIQEGVGCYNELFLFHGVLRREYRISLKGVNIDGRDVGKVTLSADPDAKGCVVAALWGEGARRKVSVCRPSSKAWRTAWEAVGTTSIHDMAFHRKQLWLACSDGSLYVLDIDESSITSVKSSLQLPRHWGDVYLLAAARKLLVFTMCFQCRSRMGWGMHLHAWEIQTFRIVELKCLDGGAALLGRPFSMFVKHRHLGSLKRDSIYDSIDPSRCCYSWKDGVFQRVEAYKTVQNLPLYFHDFRFVLPDAK